MPTVKPVLNDPDTELEEDELLNVFLAGEFYNVISVLERYSGGKSEILAEV